MVETLDPRPYRQLGTRIKELVEAKGWSGRKLAKQIGKSESYPSKLMNGANRPDAETLRDIARALGADLGELEYLAGFRAAPPDREPRRSIRDELQLTLERVPYEVPVYDQEAAAAMASGAEPISYVPVPPTVRATGRDLWAITVRGESLQPAINPGDIVVIDPDKSPIPGSFVVARINGAVVVKRYELLAAGEAALTGNNGTLPISADDLVIGVVVYRVTVL